MRTSKPQLLSRNHRQPPGSAAGDTPSWSRLRPTRPARGAAPYDARPDRPLLQVVVRAGLWVALGIGCVGGLVALLRPGSDEPGQPTVETGSDRDLVPAPVAGVAELTVERWLSASDDERQQLDELFAEPSAGDHVTGQDDAGQLTVTQVTAIGGERLEEGYWSVTVAAEVVGLEPATAETGDGETTDAAASDAGDAVPSTTWYVAIGIVSRGDGYVALTTPAVLPAPPGGDPEWTVSGDRSAPGPDDPLAEMVERFLSALLAGSGDPAPYLAPGTDLTTADPSPFGEVELVELAAEDLGDGQVWVSAHVLVTAADESATLPATYDLVLVPRSDRWEVVELSGVPTLIE